MHRHCIGSICHVLIMGVRIGNPYMGLSHNVASTRQGHLTMPGILQLSHASALYRQQMPRAYHERSRWQPVHGAQPPRSRLMPAPQGHGAGAPCHARIFLSSPTHCCMRLLWSFKTWGSAPFPVASTYQRRFPHFSASTKNFCMRGPLGPAHPRAMTEDVVGCQLVSLATDDGMYEGQPT